MVRTLQVVGAAALATLAAAGAAAGAPNEGAEGRAGHARLALAFTEDRPGASTGLDLRVRYGRDDAKPPELTAAAFELPAGTRLDLTAVPACEATDEQLRAQGTAACPPASRVGDGTLTAVTGFGAPVDPVRGDATVFNARDGLLEVVTSPETGAYLGSDRLTLEGTTLVAHPPSTPGAPPDGRTTIREIRLALPARTGAGGRPYLTTPPTCGAAAWRFEGRFGFRDGSAATVPVRQACRAAAPAAGPGGGADGGGPSTQRPAPVPRASARLRVAVGRAALVRGRRAVLGVRVRSADPSCRRGVVVRVAARRAVTDALGRARVAVTVRRARRVHVRAGKAGCGRDVRALAVRSG